MNKAITFLGLIFLLLTTSCATIFSTNRYAVSIQSSPEETDITIVDRDGQEVYFGKTPTIVELDASAGYFRRANYVVKFEKEGYHSAVATITTGIDGWYFANIVISGIIGFLIIDPATGAMYKVKQSFINEVLYPIDP
jgi:hypothetical protein